MNELPMFTAEDLARERIEAEMRDLTSCTTCGRSMLVVVRGDEMWAECASLGSKTGLRLGISASFHDRHHVDMPDGVLVAA